MSIGKILSQLLKNYNLNALELERLTGVPSSTIYRLLKNKGGNPTIDVLKKLSIFFQVTVSQLIGEESIGCRQIPLVPPSELYNFLNHVGPEKNYKTITTDFPINNKCFATYSKDNMMEPFILTNSVVIVDPQRDISNKDFILLIKKSSELPKIRQILTDGDDYYLKILNSDFSNQLVAINLNDYNFIGVIIQYRTNLFDIDAVDSSSNLLQQSNFNNG